MIRVGLIGCGYIAHKHIETLTQLQDVTLKAISDIHFNKMESIASLYKDFGGENRSITFFENYKDLLADKDIDLVIVAVFSGLHARSEEHTSELQSRGHLVCRLLLEKQKD